MNWAVIVDGKGTFGEVGEGTAPKASSMELAEEVANVDGAVVDCLGELVIPNISSIEADEIGRSGGRGNAPSRGVVGPPESLVPVELDEIGCCGGLENALSIEPPVWAVDKGDVGLENVLSIGVVGPLVNALFIDPPVWEAARGDAGLASTGVVGADV